MYQIGETVVHPSEGVCSIEAVRPMRFGNAQKDYYILKPSANRSSATVYLPVERGDAVLRRPLTPAGIVEMARRSMTLPDPWIADNRQRKEAFLRALSSGDYPLILRVVRALRERGAMRREEGKRPVAADEAILENAERMLGQEFSLVLGMDEAETAAYLRRELAGASAEAAG